MAKKREMQEASPIDLFHLLPDELVVAILAHVPCRMWRLGAARVCTHWRALLCNDGNGRRVLTACLPGHPDLRFAAIRAEDLGNGHDLGSNPLTTAAAMGHVGCLRDLLASGVRSHRTVYASHAAAAAGHIKILALLHAADCAVDAEACALAARHGRMAALRALHDLGCASNDRTAHGAIDGQHADIVAYLAEKDCLWPLDACGHAVRTGNMELLKQVCRLDHQRHSGALVCAARIGRLDMVRYLHAEGFRWCHEVLARAVQYGHVDIVRCAWENGCPLPADSACVAARHGRLDVLHYLCDQQECSQWTAYVTHEAALFGHHAVVVDAVERGRHFYRERLYGDVAQRGNVETLRYLDKHVYAGESADESGARYAMACGRAIVRGDLDMLRYVHKECRYTEIGRVAGTRADRLNARTLAYLHKDVGVPMQPLFGRILDTLNTEALIYCHQHAGFVLGQSVCMRAAHTNNLVILRYAVEHGCDWRPGECLRVVNKEWQPAMHRYLVDHIANQKAPVRSAKRP